MFSPIAASRDRHLARALASQFGHVEIVRLLLDAGEDPSRYNPVGCHSHSTPLHQAAYAGHMGVAHADSVARELFSKYEQKGWNNQDTEALATLIKQLRY